MTLEENSGGNEGVSTEPSSIESLDVGTNGPKTPCPLCPKEEPDRPDLKVLSMSDGGTVELVRATGAQCPHEAKVNAWMSAEGVTVHAKDASGRTVSVDLTFGQCRTLTGQGPFKFIRLDWKPRPNGA